LYVKVSHACGKSRWQVIAFNPSSEETYFPLFPFSATLPSGMTSQVNFSHSPMFSRLQVIVLSPFSEERYLFMLRRATFPFPASTTVNCSQACAFGLLHITVFFPSCPLTN